LCSIAPFLSFSSFFPPPAFWVFGSQSGKRVLADFQSWLAAGDEDDEEAQEEEEEEEEACNEEVVSEELKACSRQRYCGIWRGKQAAAAIN
jgi:hypothetical protein